MNNDLISRSELKKAIESLVVGGAEGLKNYYENGSKSDENAWIGGIYDAWELIDNAPTVETDIEEVGKEAYKQGYTDGWKERFGEPEERPQGEWITVRYNRDELNCPEKSMLDFVKCPFCETIHQGRRNFCSRCGADMRKGGAE